MLRMLGWIVLMVVVYVVVECLFVRGMQELILK